MSSGPSFDPPPPMMDQPPAPPPPAAASIPQEGPRLAVPRRRSLGLEIGLALLAMALVSGFAWLFQPRISIHGERGWDGTFYYQMAEQLVRHQPISTHRPFVFRVATPWLAALIAPKNLLQGFFLANLAASALTVVLLVLWFRRTMTSLWWALAMNVLFQLHWLGPVRFNWYYPALTDPWIYPFLLGGLLLLREPYDLRRDPWLFAALVAVGVCFREAVLLLPLVALAPPSLRRWPTGRQLVAAAAFALPALGAGLFVLWKIQTTVSAIGGYQFQATALGWWKDRTLAELLAGWLNTFGALAFLLVLRLPAVWRLLRDDARPLAFLLAVFALSWVAGSDVERFAMWAAPVVLLFCGHAVEKAGRRWAPLTVSCLLLAVLVFRGLLVIPQPMKKACWGFWSALGMYGTCPHYQELQYTHASPEGQLAWQRLHRGEAAAVTLIFLACLVGPPLWRRLRRPARLIASPPPSG